jgi:rhodanese-related sulfurtransferase
MLTPQEAASVANSEAEVISPQLLADIYYSQGESSNYQFVDLRTPKVFENGHIKDAINIPFMTITKNNNCKTFLNQDHINIIYGETTEQTIFAGYLLQQLGLKNYFIVLGNYDFIKNNIIDNYNVYSAHYNPEIAQYDYAKIVAETAGAQNYSAGSTSKPKVAAPIKRKKKAAAGGGCD